MRVTTSFFFLISPTICTQASSFYSSRERNKQQQNIWLFEIQCLCVCLRAIATITHSFTLSCVFTFLRLYMNWSTTYIFAWIKHWKMRNVEWLLLLVLYGKRCTYFRHIRLSRVRNFFPKKFFALRYYTKKDAVIRTNIDCTRVAIEEMSVHNFARLLFTLF